MASISQPDRRPPLPDDIPTDGEGGTFNGTNPWSGPYAVIAIIIGAVVVIGGIIVAVMSGLAAH